MVLPQDPLEQVPANICSGSHEELNAHLVHQTSSLCPVLHLQGSQPNILFFQSWLLLISVPFDLLDRGLPEGKNRDLLLCPVS